MQNKILVIGDLILDIYTNGKVKKISQEAPIPVLEKKNTELRLGGAGNVALNLKNLGSNTSVMGIIGNDSYGKFIKKEFKSQKINFYPIVIEKKKTISKERIISSNRQMLRIDDDTDWSEHGVKIFTLLKKIIKSFDIIVLSDYDKGTLNYVAPIISLAKKYNIKVYADPKFKQIKNYKKCELISPNLNEWKIISNGVKIIETKKIKEIQLKYQIKYLLITLGQEGILLFHNGKKWRYPSVSQDVYDVSGAGDTVVATIVDSLSKTDDIHLAIKKANVAAGCVIKKFGTTPIELNELNEALFQRKNKKIDLNDFLKLRKNKKIVFTNGCFDILHAGHIDLIKKSKELGDILVLGLNSDKSIKKIKGSNRPINNLENRLKVLNSIKYIDYIIVFEEQSPLKLIKAIKPDYLTKGSDYKLKDIVGYNYMKRYGGIIKIINKVIDTSTTKIINLKN